MSSGWNEKKNRAIITWLLTGCLLIFTMVIVGGITRLTRSGLSMVEWKITGSLPPLSEAEWELQFAKYKQSPEYRLINSSFSLGEYKSIFWWEYIHRFIGRSIAFVFILPFGYFWLSGRFPPGFLKKMLLLLGCGAGQGLLGWIMVKSGLDKIPHVSHYLLAAHLGTAFFVFGITCWFVLGLIFPGKKAPGDPASPLKSTAVICVVLVFVQVIFGAFVAGLKAGYLFPSFPKMGAAWIAPEAYAMKPWWKNFVANGAGVQFIHRLLAITLLAFGMKLFYRSRRMDLHPQTRRFAALFLAALLLQATLGILTLLLHVPVILASAHQTGAFILFTASLLLLHRTLKECNGIRHHGKSADEREKNEPEGELVQVADSL